MLLRDEHEVHIRLGASYPRMMPELAWKSPIFHPNISASGVVCLGGYGTYWVPSLTLDELCTMLWDMIRYENYDETSPYNREAAAWVKNQTYFRLPLDPARSATSSAGPRRSRADLMPNRRQPAESPNAAKSRSAPPAAARSRRLRARRAAPAPAVEADVVFLDDGDADRRHRLCRPLRRARRRRRYS